MEISHLRRVRARDEHIQVSLCLYLLVFRVPVSCGADSMLEALPGRVPALSGVMREAILSLCRANLAGQ